MQRAADFHHQITDAYLPQAARVVDDAAALDAAVDVLNADAAACKPSIGGFLRPREGSAPWLLGRHHDLDVVERERQEAQILEQPAPRGQGIRRGIRNPFIVGAAGIGLTQEEDRERRVDEQHVFYGVVSFLAAITARLLKRILGALDAPFGAIVAKRGEVAAGAGAAAGGADVVGDPSVGTTTAATSASATPRRFANACTDRVGASPSVRSVARRTTKRT
jgi:hypothetical protein